MIVGLHRYPNKYHKPAENGCGSYGFEVCNLLTQYIITILQRIYNNFITHTAAISRACVHDHDSSQSDLKLLGVGNGDVNLHLSPLPLVEYSLHIN